MSNIIDSIKVSGVTYEIQGSGGGGITIDPTLDSGSTNPVANSAITTALDAKVNVADNEVSGLTLAFNIGAKEYYTIIDNITKLTVKSTVSSGSGSRIVTFYIYHITGGSQINCSVKYTYQNQWINAINSTSGNITATLNNGVIDITLDSGYYFYHINSINNFALTSYKNYSGGQSARVIEGSVGQAITDVAAKIPSTILTDASLSISNSNGNISLIKTDQVGSNVFINRPLYDRKTLKYDNANGLYVNFYGETAHTVTLNTNNGNYCMIPDVASSYKDGLDSITVRVNSGYTGSTSSFTWKLNGVDYSGTTYENTYTYDKTNNTVTLSGSSTFNVSVTNDGYYFTFTPTDTNTRIWRFYETNCNIAGTGNTIPNAYIIDLVQAPTYQYNGQEVIDDIYSKLDTKQTTLTAGTGISITDNVISATGGGGSSYTAGDGIDITNNVISVTGKVDTSAITTSITSGSTDSQIPSAKAVYDIVGNIETLLSQI